MTCLVKGAVSLGSQSTEVIFPIGLAVATQHKIREWGDTADETKARPQCALKASRREREPTRGGRSRLWNDSGGTMHGGQTHSQRTAS